MILSPAPVSIIVSIHNELSCFLAGLKIHIRIVKLLSVYDPTSVTHVYMQDAEVTNLHNNQQDRREPSPAQSAPAPASPTYTGIEENEQDRWVRTHPG